MHLADRHTKVRARALRARHIRLVPADGLPALSTLGAGGRRACVRCGHETYSLRRHYPVTGSAVDAAVSVRSEPVPARSYGGQRPLSPVLRAPAIAKVPPR
ncbi:hypothetical protein STRAU_6480 [Streptomyces aurantiacus JA 4570]|uniref:Uncharacterized protein n=1 Tax=Streptomyces aurantiacus JA 4570 TaxID=1286094 RepID=S3ZBD4_9ACTN|nr:hypothetical protein STRAU_6480 [Streptomyces aurantiacus JA 4570]